LKFVIVDRQDEVLPALDGENDVDVDLRAGIRHKRNRPLLTELGNVFCSWFYKETAPDGADTAMTVSTLGEGTAVACPWFRGGAEACLAMNPWRRAAIGVGFMA